MSDLVRIDSDGLSGRMETTVTGVYVVVERPLGPHLLFTIVTVSSCMIPAPSGFGCTFELQSDSSVNTGLLVGTTLAISKNPGWVVTYSGTATRSTNP